MKNLGRNLSEEDGRRIRFLHLCLMISPVYVLISFIISVYIFRADNAFYIMSGVFFISAFLYSILVVPAWVYKNFLIEKAEGISKKRRIIFALCRLYLCIVTPAALFITGVVTSEHVYDFDEYCQYNDKNTCLIDWQDFLTMPALAIVVFLIVPIIPVMMVYFKTKERIKA